MKNKIITIDREEWEKLREFRKVPFKQKYLEILKMDQINNTELIEIH